MENTGMLSVDKRLFHTNLTMTQVLIVAHIQDCNNRNLKCTTTNNTFANMLGINFNTVCKSIIEMVNDGLINKEIKYVSGRKQGGKVRTLTLNNEMYTDIINKIDLTGNTADEYIECV